MNSEFLKSLPTEKRKIIERGYLAVLNKEKSPNQFFVQCRELLGTEDFNNLFIRGTQGHKEHPASAHSAKTEYLHDIIQYAGVDLKEEADNIVKDNVERIGHVYRYEEDRAARLDSLLNVDLFVEYVNRLSYMRGIKVSNECYEALFKGLRRKLLDLLDRMNQASRIRVDALRSEFVIKVCNDTKRQLWVLEEAEKKAMEKLKIKRSDGEDEQKKKIRKTIQEREDLIIKKRMSNSVALAALGIQQKSWMNIDNTVTVKENDTPFQSLFAPFNEKEFERKIKNRTITVQDLIYVFSRDKRYNKSIFTIQQYFFTQ
ncbi:Transcription initiation factor TFIID subunit 4 [Astathelohania contejeani]|uniref:Transcription initiation factor TFIID subunit 4 n=1 Tax=Astathelohania contejeani TaxID=164912 RepID=A0ABQ7I0Y2_9MICR|nr:Transcription initiation factor TFIID subunit 4 [Thelohania contejeani]